MSMPRLATVAPELDALEDESLNTPTSTSAPKPFPPETASTTTAATVAAIMTNTTTSASPNTTSDPIQPTHQYQSQQQSQSSSLTQHCITDRPLPTTHQHHQQSTGEITKFSDIETYISKPADYPSTPAKLLLFLTNGRGIHSLNNQLQADLYAQQGFVVIMPDLFSGDAAPSSTAATTVNIEEVSWLDSIKARVVETGKSFMIDMWLARHGPEKVMPILSKVLEHVREEFADAVGHGGGGGDGGGENGIYAVGYCFGGKYVLMLAGERSDSVMAGQDGREADVEAGMVKTGPEIKCGAVAHGTLVTREDLVGIKVPVSLVCVENDPLFPEEILEYGRQELTSAGIEHEIRLYPGVPHGFAVLGEYGSVTIQEAQTAASDQLLGWLISH